MQRCLAIKGGEGAEGDTDSNPDDSSTGESGEDSDAQANDTVYAPVPQEMGNGWLEAWSKKAFGKNVKLVWSGCYYEFQTPERVLSAGCDGDFTKDTPCALTSCTKVFAGLAVMRTMHLKPQDWYPEKYMHEFPGWEDWRDFKVLDNVDTDGKPGWSGRRSSVTVHQLLTHTCGWPFGLHGERSLIKRIPLYFQPGTYFGYSIGHRILGWMLLDYWKAQPEGAQFEKLNDVFEFLIYRPLNLSEGTGFIQERFGAPHSIMGEFFDMSFFDSPDVDNDDDPADLAMASTGADMMKVSMLALRRGQLPDGSWYIPKAKWDDWAAKNKLPDGKLSSALAGWRMEDNNLSFAYRTIVTRTVNAGPFGWSYFGATYHDYEGDGDAGPAIAVGWKGFSSCGLRADYAQNVAFVAMQEIVPDPGCRNFGECIHQGKVGEYTLRFVGDRLAETDPQMLEDMKEGPVRCCCCHEIMLHKEETSLCTSCVQGTVRCVFRVALPCGVKVLQYHSTEAED